MGFLGRLIAPACVLVLAACGSNSGSSSGSASNSGAGSSQSSTASPPSAAAPHVTMQNVSFQPATLHAKVGQTVLFTNDDNPPHNVTYVSGPKFTSSPRLDPGAKFSLKLTQAGTIHYFCTIHPFMKGTIVVTK